MKETLEERIGFLIRFTRGTCPYGMVVDTNKEAARAREILKRSKKKGAKLIMVKVDPI